MSERKTLKIILAIGAIGMIIGYIIDRDEYPFPSKAIDMLVVTFFAVVFQQFCMLLIEISTGIASLGTADNSKVNRKDNPALFYKRIARRSLTVVVLTIVGVRGFFYG